MKFFDKLSFKIYSLIILMISLIFGIFLLAQELIPIPCPSFLYVFAGKHPVLCNKLNHLKIP